MSSPISRSASSGAIAARIRRCASATPRPGAGAPSAGRIRRAAPGAGAAPSDAAIAPATAARAQVERLRRDEQLDRQDPLDVLEDVARVPRRDRAHRDVVLLVGARRDRIDRRRMGQDLVLRHEGGGGVLVDHHPGVEPGRRRARNAGSPPLSRGSTSSAVRRSLIEPSSASASFAKSSASAIGSPWKLPPLMTRPPPVAIASASATPPPGRRAGCRSPS